MQVCDECGINPANIHLTQLMQDETQVFHLCEECARKKGISVSINGDVQLTGEELQGQDAASKEDKTCPVCGLKMSEFRAKGWLGCSSCYVAFENEINDLLVQVHGSSIHKGKRYAKAEDGNGVTSKIKRLRCELAVAVKNEEFEQAAILRDAIQSLKQLGD